jgi:hypothetical protein
MDPTTDYLEKSLHAEDGSAVRSCAREGSGRGCIAGEAETCHDGVEEPGLARRNSEKKRKKKVFKKADG